MSLRLEFNYYPVLDRFALRLQRAAYIQGQLVKFIIFSLNIILTKHCKLYLKLQWHLQKEPDRKADIYSGGGISLRSNVITLHYYLYNACGFVYAFNSSHGGRYIILYVPFMLHDYFKSFAFVLWIHECVYDVSDRSITVWRHCWAVRIMRAAPHSTMPADWVSMTQWRTCWASLGRMASLASPRTRSLSCILLLSEFNGSPKAWLSVPSD